MSPVEMRYPDVMTQGEHVTTAFIEMIYRQARSIRPVNASNIWFFIRHPVFCSQMVWFTAKLFAVLHIDRDHLREIYQVRR
jgi:hypothetical protein